MMNATVSVASLASASVVPGPAKGANVQSLAIRFVDQNDPLLKLVRQYRRAHEIVNSDGLPEEHWDESYNTYITPAYLKIVRNCPSATSLAGVLAALDFVLTDEKFSERTPNGELHALWVLVKAARDYVALAVIQSGEVVASPIEGSPAAYIAAEADPVYAAIDNYKASYDFLGECIDKADEFRKRIWERADAEAVTRMQTRIAFEAANPEQPFNCSQEEMRNRFRSAAIRRQEGSPDDVEFHALCDRGHDANRAAALALLTTKPTTDEGASALLAFIRDREEGGNDNILGVVDDEETPGVLVLVSTLEKYLRPV
jgi:hypothetical protein